MSSPSTKPTSAARPRLTATALLTAALLGGGGTLIVILLLFGGRRNAGWTELNEPAFVAARQRWKAAGVSDYDIEITVTGRQPAIYRVAVRNNTAQFATRNGAPLKQRRTFETWSVPGMFETISIDLDHIQRVASGKAEVSSPHISVRVVFDPQFGFPQRYLRVERGGISGNPEVNWEVTKFAPAENEEDVGTHEGVKDEAKKDATKSSEEGPLVE